MKIILNKIEFHPLFLITTLIFILIGKFRFMLYFMLLIFIHEMGHILTSLLFKWKIDKVIILPFGGLTKYDIMINTPLIEDFLVAISGVSIQIIFFITIKNIINYKYFSFINYFIIIFNLIPIYPLDGSKILNVLLNKITSFKNSNLLTVIISYIFIIVLSIVLININKIIILVLIFLFREVDKLYKERNLIFNKFLLERYIKELKFKKEITINNVDKMKKDYRHLFYINNNYITEKYFLEKYFDLSKLKK